MWAVGHRHDHAATPEDWATPDHVVTIMCVRLHKVKRQWQPDCLCVFDGDGKVEATVKWVAFQQLGPSLGLASREQMARATAAVASAGAIDSQSAHLYRKV